MKSIDIFWLPEDLDMTPYEVDQYLHDGNPGPFLRRTARLFSTEPYGSEIDDIVFDSAEKAPDIREAISLTDR